MTVVETVLVFVAIPVAVYLVFGVAGMGRRVKPVGRYTLGEQWSGAPVWYHGHPRPHEHVEPPPALPALAAGASDTPTETLKGGASGNW